MEALRWTSVAEDGRRYGPVSGDWRSGEPNRVGAGNRHHFARHRCKLVDQSMKWARHKRSERNRGGVLAREIDVPLPLGGLFVEAKTAEVSGMYAAELLNWQSTGASLELRNQHVIDAMSAQVSQYIPLEFGQFLGLIGVGADRFTFGKLFQAYDGPGITDFGYISSHVVMVDGTQAPQLFNGSEFSLSQFTTDTERVQSEFDGFVAHQDRPYFWKTGDDLDFYYGGVGAITGTLTRFPLGRLGNITGKIVAMRPVTVNAGHGMNDTLAIFTSTGKLVAYEGRNPGDEADWRLLTRLQIAPPLDKNAFIQVGADQWMLTTSGIVSVTQTIQDSTLALVKTVSRNIQKKLIKQIAEGGDWSMHLAADGTTVIINRVWEGRASQFMYRTQERIWLEADYPAKQWHNFDLKTQFTTLDGDLATLNDDGTFAITAKLVTSWFRLPRAASISYIVPTVIARGPLKFKIAILSDHDETAVDFSEAEQTVTIRPDDPADPGGTVALNEEIAVDAVGEVFQIHMEVTAQWAELVHLKAAIL